MFLFSFEKNPLFAGARGSNPPGNVHKYAEATGGEVMTSSKKDISTKLAQLIDEIRSRYTLGYYPSAKQAKDTFCAIKVELAPETAKREGKLVVRTKQGYYR
jgi:hypothetical protein